MYLLKKLLFLGVVIIACKAFTEEPRFSLEFGSSLFASFIISRTRFFYKQTIIYLSLDFLNFSRNWTWDFLNLY